VFFYLLNAAGVNKRPGPDQSRRFGGHQTHELQVEVKRKEEMEAALRASEEMYRQRALHDPLTGLYNRGYFFEAVAREIESLKRRKNSHCCLVMMDIDYFKKFNDSYGHLCGDQALKMVASTIDSSLRKSDIFARYGGEEFSLYLANADMEKGSTIAERIRLAVASQPSPAPDGQKPVTISLGLCAINSTCLNPLSSGSKILLDAMAVADAALYTAKEKGRNMVWASEFLPTGQG
ncbi:GGDEF domain-containing protein, partial [Deltaproteobacteria bacterium OttesenSCG-928-K17]|nr:GGDEF domain-containing protein [Deltaproteobacteria bacterium OttesenSCG-928-K17]